MTTWEAVILSMLQGVAEFFPISSSGHLAIAERMLGTSVPGEHLLFTVVLHLGTLLAIAIGLWPTIRRLDRQYLLRLGIGIAPLFPLVLALKPLKAAMASGAIVGPFFMVTGVWLLAGETFGRARTPATQAGTPPSDSPYPAQGPLQTPWRAALTVGFAQAIALFPGISRMGATVSTGRFCGWSRTEALTFSLLLAIPTILGATAVEVASAFKGSTPLPAIPFTHYVLGFAIAFGVGLLSLRLILRIAERASFRGFGYYCLALGLVTVLLDRL